MNYELAMKKVDALRAVLEIVADLPNSDAVEVLEWCARQHREADVSASLLKAKAQPEGDQSTKVNQ